MDAGISRERKPILTYRENMQTPHSTTPVKPGTFFSEQGYHCTTVHLLDFIFLLKLESKLNSF